MKNKKIFTSIIVGVTILSNCCGNFTLSNAAYEHVISVAATDEKNKKAHFTSYGDWVDVSAPGEGIYTCDVGSTYWYYDGTSFSSPIVAGTMAIMKAYNRISVDEAEKIIKATATDIGITGMGAGLLNSGWAIQKTKYMSFKDEKEAKIPAKIKVTENSSKGYLRLLNKKYYVVTSKEELEQLKKKFVRVM